MIDKPSDIVVVFVIVALLVTGYGLMYNDVAAWGSSANDSTAVFANMSQYSNSGNFVKGSSDTMTQALGLDNAPQTETGFIESMFAGLLSVGKVWSGVTHAIGDFATELRIDPAIVSIVSIGLIITLALSIYLWYRGSK